MRHLVTTVKETPGEYDSYEGTPINTAQKAEAILRPLLENQPQEVFAALALDGKHRLSGYYEISRGTLTTSLVHPREVFGPAIRLGLVAGIIVGHNHPSGDPAPSKEDEEVTTRLIAAGKLLGIPLLDHIIIGGSGRFFEFRKSGRCAF